MRSSYRIIKGDIISGNGIKNIVTIFEKNIEENGTNSIINSYEKIIQSMIEDARRKREKILSKAYEEAGKIEEEAYKSASERGYKDGCEKGYEEAFKKAYQEGYAKNIEKARIEGEDIKNKASLILKASVEEKNRYLKEKEEEIKKFIINVIENILKQEIKNNDSLNNIVFNELLQVRNTETFIIKSRKKYCDEFKKEIDIWRERLPFKGDIFIIPDETVEEGTVVIEKNNGKSVFSIDIAMKKIREIFKSVE
ncbi:flagellar assembly protein FliH [Clostridium sp. WILCCON 0269]|uniref:Flagellar assembly protein FliH n=1 Tax=Candidatus Clostridium eludens TaxID=3381663 RepID=A0ABW8SHH3_9CLOT